MRNKWIIGAVIVLVAVAIGYFIFARERAAKVTYRFEKVSRGDVVVAISATGTLNAVTTVQVGSQVSGTISKLYADFNSRVEKGQLLAQLDPRLLESAVELQRANLAKAQAQVNESQRNYDRAKGLFEHQLISQADMDSATTDLETAKAALVQAKAQLNQSQVNLGYATITAPVSGVVISRNVDVGQTVAASLQAPTLFTIAEDLSHMQVQASIDEADIGNVRVGERVTFRVDAYPEQVFEGTVSQVRLEPVTTQNVVTYNVMIDVANPDQKLMPGMTATVSVEAARKDNVLRIPLQALRFTPPNAPADTTGSTGRRGQNGQTGAMAQNAPNVRERSDSLRPRGEQDGFPQGSRQGGFGRQRRDTMSVVGSDTMHRADTAGAQQRSGTPGRVWVWQDGGPKAVRIIRGIQDSRYAELVRGPLQEGDSVIIGSVGSQASTQQTQNPFMPRFPGGGGGRGGGR